MSNRPKKTVSYRESESEDEEVTKPSAATMPSGAIMPSTASKPSTRTKSSADKERRAMNKRVREEVLRLIPQFKSVLTKPREFKEIIGKHSFLKWQMVEIILVICFLASPEYV